MKIAVVGTGYVDPSIFLLLAQHYDVVAIGILPERMALLKRGQSSIDDADITCSLQRNDLRFRATLDAQDAYSSADFVVITTPTNYDPERNYFDTSSIETVVTRVRDINSRALMVIKSTVPLGYTERMRGRFATDRILSSPEFLREGHALDDNLHPGSIVAGERPARGGASRICCWKAPLKRTSRCY